jgi:hypothetical protein
LYYLAYSQHGSVRANNSERNTAHITEIDDDPIATTINNVITSLGLVNTRSNARIRNRLTQ